MSPTPPDGQEPGASANGGVAGKDTIGLLMDMEMPLLVRFGSTRMPLSDLLALGTGSVIEFRRSPEDPVELLVNGRVVARAMVVVVQGNYGVRITEIATQREDLVKERRPAARTIRGN